MLKRKIKGNCLIIFNNFLGNIFILIILRDFVLIIGYFMEFD